MNIKGRNTKAGLDIQAVAARRVVRHNVNLHWHDCCEVELVLSGSGQHVINGHTYPLQAGSLYFFTPADCHSIEIEEPLEVLNIMFDDELISEELYAKVLSMEMAGVDLNASLSEQQQMVVKNYFESVRKELDVKTQDKLATFYVRQLFNCIVIELLRGVKNKKTAEIETKPLKKAILYLHHHYHEPIKISDLAEQLHFAPGYLSTYFKEHIGCSFKEYLTKLRLKHVCHLLVNTKMNATDICFACGFSSYSHFMRTFRKHYQESPMLFRKHYQVDSDEQEMIIKNRE